VQFETIHPFLDGNGRVGRLLITLLLCHAGVLREPLLYLSLYLKQHRAEYYGLLDAVRQQGDWEAWLEFFLDGVEKTAHSAVDTANRLTAMFAQDRAVIAKQSRKASSALRVHEVLQQRPTTRTPATASAASTRGSGAARSRCSCSTRARSPTPRPRRWLQANGRCSAAASRNAEACRRTGGRHGMRIAGVLWVPGFDPGGGVLSLARAGDAVGGLGYQGRSIRPVPRPISAQRPVAHPLSTRRQASRPRFRLYASGTWR
jgi:hypothetical protein